MLQTESSISTETTFDDECDSEPKIPEFYDLIDKQGGFGRFQKLVFVTLVLGISSGSWMNYDAAYLLLYPKFNCLLKDSVGNFTIQADDSDKCLPSYFCYHNETVQWSIDYEDQHSLDNWMKQYDLYCADPSLLSYIGTFWFFGFAIFSPIVPVLSDKYGRRKFLIGTFTIQASIFVVVLNLPGHKIEYYYIIIAMWFVSGSISAARSAIGVSYMCEFSPGNKSSFMITSWNIFQGLVSIWLTLHYRFVGKRW